MRRFRTRLSTLLSLSMLAALLPLVAAPVLAATTADVVINEIDADQSGTDSAEFIELYDGGDGTTDLTGLSIVLYNGSDDQSYLAFDLDGLSTDGDGYFVLCGNAATVANCDLDVSPDTNLIQNGADAAALVVGDAVNYPNDTALPAGGDVVDAIVYDTDDSDDAVLLAALTPGEPQVNERAGGDGTGHSNQLCGDGYAQAAPTPGGENTCPLPPAPAISAFIHEVQGAGSSSPLVGIAVEIQGVVVGDFQTGGFRGFHVQEEDADADADPATSEGVFVYYPPWVGGVEVQLGDVVTVVGQVSEFFGLTQISADTVSVDSSGALVTPAELSLPLAGFDLETVEGMSVHFGQALTISEYWNYDRFGEIVLTNGRPFQPTATYAPGSPEAALAAVLNADNRITLDDGQTKQNPDFTRHPNGAEFTSTNYFRGGDTLTDVVGVMDYSFGNYKIQPTGAALYSRDNARTSTPAWVGGNLTVATFNVLNYFSTIDGSGDICGPDGDQGCRGADNDDEFSRQRTKIFAAIAAMDADVVGLMEIENHATDEALKDLVDGLNDYIGSDVYTRVDSGTPGGDVIKVALIYKESKVTLDGIPAVLDTADFVDPLGVGRDLNRAAIAQAFIDDLTGVGFVVSVNHLKSKGSGCGSPDDDPEAGSCNASRTAAAGVLAAWLDTDPTDTDYENTLIIGDLNSYDHETPITALASAGYVDVVRDRVGENAYSYVFSGQWGYLDYVMANASIDEFITGATVWHINADEADLIDYDTRFKSDAQIDAYTPDAFRSSDHDPVIIGLQFDQTPPSVHAQMDVMWHSWKKGRFIVDFSCTDNLDPSPTCVATVNGLLVADGQHVMLVRSETESTSYWQGGRLYIVDSEFELTVVSTDASGNTTTVEVDPVFKAAKGRQRL